MNETIIIETPYQDPGRYLVKHIVKQVAIRVAVVVVVHFAAEALIKGIEKKTN